MAASLTDLYNEIATIHREIRAGDEGGLIRGQVENERGAIRNMPALF